MSFGRRDGGVEASVRPRATRSDAKAHPHEKARSDTKKRDTGGVWETFRPFAPWAALAVVGIPGVYLGSLATLSAVTRPPVLTSTAVGTSGLSGTVMITSSGDAEIDAAIVRARSSLDEFWQRAAAPGTGESDFMVKVALRTRRGGLEHIWVASPVKSVDGYSGRLANDPQDIPGAKAGSRIEFKEGQVSDWMYRRDGKIVGNRTLRVLLPRMPEGQAAQYRNMLAD